MPNPTTILFPSQGGTGTNISPTTGQILVANSSGVYVPTTVSFGGTVTSFSSADANATVANATTTPVITIVSAPKLQNARNINGVAFDGTANITVADSTKVPTTTTVNGHALSSNVSISASDVGAPSGSGTSTGTNTGDQTNITGNAGTVTNGVYTTGAGTVFLAPNGSAAALTSFPTLNQNTTGTAASLSATLVPASGGTGVANNNSATVTSSGNFAYTRTLTGATNMTYPAVTDTVAVLGTAQTFTATQTQKQEVWTNNAITASGNAATVPITYRLNTVTNNSAATLTITMATASAVDGQLCYVRVLDSSGVTQTITWVNTENSTATVPTTSNGSTTFFLSVGFIFNGATSKWRCIASA